MNKKTEHRAKDGDDSYRTKEETEALRSQLEDDLQSFLAQGGKIEEVQPNIMADPPKKPESNYGSRPI